MGENDQFSFDVFQEYLRKDGLVTKTRVVTVCSQCVQCGHCVATVVTVVTVWSLCGHCVVTVVTVWSLWCWFSTKKNVKPGHVKPMRKNAVNEHTVKEEKAVRP